MKRVKLFCFPYAGGSATIYYKWKAYLDKNIELVPVELSGRGKRFREPFYKDMRQMIEDVYGIVSPRIEECDYLFLGHSMGSIIALEVCRKIIENRQKQPVHIFVSGRRPPHIDKEKEYLSRLPDDQFTYEISKIGGTNREVIENRELLNIFIPILKSDYRLIEEYEFVNGWERMNCGITVFHGRQDNGATYNEMLEWGKYTFAESRVFEFNGGHFFIHENYREIAGIINSTLSNYVMQR